jgi:D-methionine transport system ATP-binding protein
VLCRNVAILEKGRLVEQFAVLDAPTQERKTALGREIDELVRRREREAREPITPRPLPVQRSAQEVAYV